MVIVIGWGFINPANHTPFIPAPTTYTTPQGVTHPYGGIMGILGAAGVVFFAFIGFDAVSTAAQEAKNPKRDMPIGILGSLVVCTVLYVLFSHVLSGVATVEDFRTAGKEASVAFAISKYMTGYEWLSKFVTVAILAGFSSVILVMLLGQSRVFYSMSHDGLVPKIFSDVHPKLQDAVQVEHAVLRLHRRCSPAFMPGDIVGEMTSIGTLFAFILVCAGVWIMRVQPARDLARGFTVPALPLVAILGIVVCGAMIYGLGWTNWLRLIVWLVIGLVFYFGYGMQAQPAARRTPPKPGADAASVTVLEGDRWFRAQGPVFAVALLVFDHRRRHGRLHGDRRLERVGRVLHDGHHGHDGRLPGSPRPVARRPGVHRRPAARRRRRGALHVHPARDRGRRGRAAEAAAAAPARTHARHDQGSLHHLRLRPHRQHRRRAVPAAAGAVRRRRARSPSGCRRRSTTARWRWRPTPAAKTC